MNKENIAKTYNPKQVEDKLYAWWEKEKFFHAEVDKNKKSFTIVIPPPNITGQLHMGHALDNAMQDILIRMKRMQGYSALWLPGTDHASIATEAKIVEQMRQEGIFKEDLGREAFLERAWEWKHNYGSKIVNQLKKLGSSCDWDRERFTLDEGLSKAVTEVFIRLYNKGLIYKGERIINWCPKCNTSISEAEVDHEEQQGHFWHIKYPIEGSDKYVVIATTRPETMLGDTAVAVNPKDERYTDLVGKFVILPLLNKRIPIIADEYVDMEFGTGVVKITPAHDPNDFEVGLRHNLEQIRIMNDDATINELGGIYQGMDRYDARKKIIDDLKSLGLLVKVEDHVHNVGACYRCGTTIEPIMSKQWFVKMESLAKPAVDAVRNEEVQFVPDRFSKTYFNWMDNIRDWCISRQLWWGHRIPAYYCASCGDVVVSAEKPNKCEKCGGEYIQDEDTLDTWFSSALWPFSTLGWPDKTADLEYFFPTDVLVTGYDIIFFWVARMIFSSLENMGEVPFKHVLIHGLVRDEQGRKMSKSLGNGIDPLLVIDEYGADALRFALTIGNAAGNDLRFSEDKIQASRNFTNKIWNATRFVLMNFEEEADFSNIDKNKFTVADKWILSKMNSLIKEVTDNLENFEIGIALQKIYEFIWEQFCDWYIELVKPRLYDKESEGRTEAQYVLNTILVNSMKLLHPYMPFITEEIYQHLYVDSKSIMISSWPVYSEEFEYIEEEKMMGIIMNAVRSIRNTRTQMNVPYSRKASIIFIAQDEIAEVLKNGETYFQKLAGASDILVRADKEGIDENCVSAVIDGAEIYMPLTDLIDIDKEIERLNEEKERLSKELKRVNGKLGNKKFVSNAPEKIVEEEKEKKNKYQSMYDIVIERIEVLSK